MLKLTSIITCFAALALGQQAVVLYDAQSAPLRFAAAEMRAAWAQKGVSVAELACCEAPAGGVRVVLAAGQSQVAATLKSFPAPASKASAAQSYSIRKAGTATYLVLGADAAGAMYGGLELAESIRFGALEETKDSDASPHIAQRGIKFNIPLDARTPSYSDNSDSAQQNIGEMWSMDFWREFLDEMARHRYNVLSLWSLHLLFPRS